ncbi:MAG TPA: hypothetical protein VE954_10270 [Oligoflexus sp.]|uniref:hypothetical protein n=1 Tax=Oligoflexus sp. TaxID=1971216 RepID=UPI002D26C96D|nr:hypothetical protein [Oligoflexus sp.]HYX33488.1 hypothetical protein [Oligoflexus sp.]
MSHKFFTWTFGLIFASPALAYSGAQHIDLPNCGGHAMVYRNAHQTVIKIEDVRECSNLTVNGQRYKMQPQSHDRHAYVYTWRPTLYRDQLTLRVHSNSSRTEDYVHLHADEHENYGGKRRPHWDRPVTWKPHHQAPVVTVREDDLIYLDEARNSSVLPACGGRVRVELERQRLLVRLEGPNTCDRVRLTVFNQQPLVMESVRRYDRGSQVWSFRLPERSVRPGRNSLTLAVQNSHHDRADYVRYYFSDQRWFFASGGR